MKLTIFNVSHGFCAYLIADNGNVMLFDCSHNEETGFRPSTYLPAHRCIGIEQLIIQNYDQDHVSDLHNLAALLNIDVLVRNQSISPETLKQIKEQSGPLTRAMAKAIHMHGEYTHPVTYPPDFAGIEFEVFHNNYPQFTDTNNLSLVSFVYYDGIGIVFTGDLEKAGWDALLENTSFCSHLKRTNIFIASHHGRSTGYCKEVFDHCSPDIVIISDKEIVHETQKQTYAQHAHGIPWNGGSEKRYVLTTRSDGDIKFTKSIGDDYHIQIG
jgi:beta-lactamase superfamily II metal-dependent hydrolase